MNYKMMGRFIAQILIIEGIFMIPAVLLSLYDGDMGVVKAYLITLAIIAVIVGVLLLVCTKADKNFYAKEGMVCVGISWIVMSLLGCLPFYISREIPNFIDAFFEVVSGFSTTGASILNDIESMSRGLLFWRSFTHWLGGMGMLVFLLAVTSEGGKSSGFTMHLLRAESPGPNVGKLVPRMKETARILYFLYFVLTILNFVFLLFGGMSVFDAVCTACGTAGTGGFGVKGDSIAGYSPYIQNVCTVFMLLFGVNFSCYYLLLLKQFKAVFFDEELRVYLLMVFGSIAIIAFNIRGLYPTLEETIRHSAFQVAAIVTTTGFATTDFDVWPTLSKTILLALMLVGACAGSTGGGMKVGRAMLVVKNLVRNMRQIINPQKVQVVRNNGQMVSEAVLKNTSTYLSAYVCIIVGSIIILSIDGFSVATNISAVISCFNNIGPGLDAVGPVCNYSGFSVLSKLVLIIDMLAGRLEIFPIIVLLSKSTWRHK